MALALNSFFTKRELEKEEIASLIYHDIFDYPLTESQLAKWRAGEGVIVSSFPSVGFLKGFYFLEGKRGVVYKRLLREKLSKEKLKIARKAGQILSLVPWIKMVGITGALAMNNAAEAADIDLIVVTQTDRLWTCRLLALTLLALLGFPVRRFGDKDQKNKLCLNLWLDESSLVWPRNERNCYTAHEIAQIQPIVNKDSTYEKFSRKNIWIKRYWPNALKIAKMKIRNPRNPGMLGSIFENFAFFLQYTYMRGKITKEKVSASRALFHPQSWTETVLSRLTP